MFEYERGYWDAGVVRVAGVDEAGRGPLAGPVSCAAVIMPPDDIVPGVNDSKKLSERKREQLYELIVQKAISWNVVLVDNLVIDEINILNATKRGMTQAIEGLSVPPDVVLLDAVKLPLPMESRSIVHGDALSYSIAAASILAKVTRDRLMRGYEAAYPGYGFAKHKGYGTREHYDAIARLGVTPIHRTSFLKNVDYDGKR